MAHSIRPPKKLGDVIDDLDRIREELLTIQRSLEKIEPVETLVSSAMQMNNRPTDQRD
jgi:hypothetical protein